MRKVKKTVKISDATDVKLRKVAEQMHISQGSVIEKAISAFSPESVSSSEQLLVWSELRHLSRETQNMLNILNSMVYNLEFKDYHSAQEDPYIWLITSNAEYKDRIIKSKTTALLGKEKNEP